MDRYRPRQELRSGVVAAFARCPEVREIHVFGTEVDGEPDEYSDIDMIVCSSDLARTGEHYMRTLSTISPVIGTYVIRSDERELAEMVMLRDYSPYQKIDLSIVDAIGVKEDFGPFKRVYRDSDGLANRSSTALNPVKSRGGLANRMNDILFSVPRFTKCLFRGDRDMYRRWTTIVNATLVMLHESHFGWSDDARQGLRPYEHKALGKALTTEQRAKVDAILPLDGRPDLAAGFRLAIDMFVDLCRERSVALGERADLSFAQHVRGFLKHEVDRYQANGIPPT